MTENDDLKKEPNRETEAALEAVANQDVARFTNVGSLLADLNDELIKQTTNAMAREFEKGEEIEAAVKAEVEAIAKWLKAHGMRQIANSIERGDYK